MFAMCAGRKGRSPHRAGTVDLLQAAIAAAMYVAILSVVGGV